MADTAMEKHERDGRYHLRITLFAKIKNTCENEGITGIISRLSHVSKIIESLIQLSYNIDTSRMLSWNENDRYTVVLWQKRCHQRNVII